MTLGIFDNIYMKSFLDVSNVEKMLCRNLTIKNSRFLNKGIAIFSSHIEPVVYFKQCNFESNSIFYWYEDLTTLISLKSLSKAVIRFAFCNFIGNRIYTEKNPSETILLAPSVIIEGTDTRSTYSDSNFTDNFFDPTGSSVFSDFISPVNNIEQHASHNILMSTNSMSATRCIFKRNGRKPEIITGEGAAIKASGLIRITDCIFEENVANNAALVFEFFRSTTIVNSTFLNNFGKKSSAISWKYSNNENIIIEVQNSQFIRDEKLEKYYPETKPCDFSNSFITINTTNFMLILFDSNFTYYPYLYYFQPSKGEKMVKQHPGRLISATTDRGMSANLFGISIKMKENPRLTFYLENQLTGIEDPFDYEEEMESLSTGNSLIEFMAMEHYKAAWGTYKSKVFLRDSTIEGIVALDDFRFRRYNSFFIFQDIFFEAQNVKISNVLLNTPLFTFKNATGHFLEGEITNFLGTSVFILEKNSSLHINDTNFQAVTNYEGTITMDPLSEERFEEHPLSLLQIANVNFSKIFGRWGSVISIHSLFDFDKRSISLFNVYIQNCSSVVGGAVFTRGKFKIAIENFRIERTAAFEGTAMVTMGQELVELGRDWSFDGEKVKYGFSDSALDQITFSDNVNLLSQPILPIMGCETVKVALLLDPAYTFKANSLNSSFYDVQVNQTVYEIDKEDFEQNSYINLLKIHSKTTDEIPNELLKLKERGLFQEKQYTIFVQKNASLSSASLNLAEMEEYFPGVKVNLGIDFLTTVKIGFMDCQNQFLIPYFFTGWNQLFLEHPKSNSSLLVSNGVNSIEKLQYSDLIELIGEWISQSDDIRNVTLQIRFSSEEFADSFILFKIMLEPCPNGFYRENNIKTCHPCPFGQFSIMGVTNASKCYDCTEEGICEKGLIYTKENFWRISKDSLVIIKCPKNASCVSESHFFPRFEPIFNTENYINRSCANGYIGASCSQCDTMGMTTINGSKFFDKGECIEAVYTFPEVLGNALKLLWSFCFVIFNILASTFFQNLGMIKMAISDKSQTVEDAIFNSSDDSPSPILKIFMIYLTVIRFILYLIEDKLPPIMKVFIFSSSNSFDAIKNYLDYFLVFFIHYTPIWNFYALFLIIFILAFFTFGISALYYFKTIKLKKQKYWGSYVFTTFLVFYLYASPEIVYICTRNILALYIKRPDDTDTEGVGKVSFYAPSMSYSDPSLGLIKRISSVGLVFFVLVIPLFFVIRIRIALKKRRMNLKNFYIKYSYYFKEFKENYYYFEILRVITKMLFSFLAVLPGIDISVKLMLVMIMFSLYYLLILKVKPYKTQMLNNFDRISGMVFLVTMFGGLIVLNIFNILYEDPSLSMYAPWEQIFYQVIFTITCLIIFISNSFYIVSICRIFYRIVHKTLNEKKKEVEIVLKKAFSRSKSKIERALSKAIEEKGKVSKKSKSSESDSEQGSSREIPEANEEISPKEVETTHEEAIETKEDGNSELNAKDEGEKEETHEEEEEGRKGSHWEPPNAENQPRETNASEEPSQKEEKMEVVIEMESFVRASEDV